jgi:hypothetical protein
MGSPSSSSGSSASGRPRTLIAARWRYGTYKRCCVAGLCSKLGKGGARLELVFARARASITSATCTPCLTGVYPSWLPVLIPRRHDESLAAFRESKDMLLQTFGAAHPDYGQVDCSCALSLNSP